MSQAELARKHGLSCARVNHRMTLLKLPGKEIKPILEMGDHWEPRLVTEQTLRG